MKSSPKKSKYSPRVIPLGCSLKLRSGSTYGPSLFLALYHGESLGTLGCLDTPNIFSRSLVDVASSDFSRRDFDLCVTFLEFFGTLTRFFGTLTGGTLSFLRNANFLHFAEQNFAVFRFGVNSFPQF